MPAGHNNVEWVFSKKGTENERPMYEQVLSLAHALKQLPADWPVNNSTRIEALVKRLLGLTKNDWLERAWKHIGECHPPIHELSPPSYAMTFVRWMLWSILPYATFLWDRRPPCIE